MPDITTIIDIFNKEVSDRVPELIRYLRGGTYDGLGNYELLEAPWPLDPNRCTLGVLWRPEQNCFEISFSVLGTRGQAERQFIYKDDLTGAVTETIEFISDILAGRILVDIHRYRLFWFQHYYLPFFREASIPIKSGVIETISWRGSFNQKK